MPRSAVVMDGNPVSKLLVSVRTIASACSSFAFFFRNAVRWPDPTSSSPSTTIFTFSGRPPPPLRQDSTAEVWTTMPALSSAAPRPYRRGLSSGGPLRSVGSNGGLAHASSSPAGCTS
jgi:hypothetical protein